MQYYTYIIQYYAILILTALSISVLYVLYFSLVGSLRRKSKSSFIAKEKLIVETADGTSGVGHRIVGALIVLHKAINIQDKERHHKSHTINMSQVIICTLHPTHIQESQEMTKYHTSITKAHNPYYSVLLNDGFVSRKNQMFWVSLSPVMLVTH